MYVRMLQCAAVCCSLLQCVVVNCSVLQCVAMEFGWCMSACLLVYIELHNSSVLQHVAACYTVKLYVAVYRIVLQCVAVRCNMLQCVALLCTV